MNWKKEWADYEKAVKAASVRRQKEIQDASDDKDRVVARAILDYQKAVD